MTKGGMKMRTLTLIDKEISIEKYINRSEVNELLIENKLSAAWNYVFSFVNGGFVQIRAKGSFQNSALLLSGSEEQWEIIKDEYGDVLLINKNKVDPY